MSSHVTVWSAYGQAAVWTHKMGKTISGLIAAVASAVAWWKCGVAWGVAVAFVLAFVIAIRALYSVAAEVNTETDPQWRNFVDELKALAVAGRNLRAIGDNLGDADDDAWADEVEQWRDTSTAWFSKSHPAHGPQFSAGAATARSTSRNRYPAVRAELSVLLANLDGLIANTTR